MTENASQHVSTRYDWIDVLRAIAILMVIAVHTSHGLKGTDSFLKSAFGLGGFGVQLFFIASAMTLCMSMQRNYRAKNTLYYYCIRRFFRIAPLYYIGIVVYFFWSFAKNYTLTGALAPLPQYVPANILANLFFVHGFIPAANNNIVPGGWSIGTEVAFYVIFPLLFSAFHLERKRRSVVLFASLLVGSEFLLLRLVEQLSATRINNNEFLYFNIVSQLQVFVLGMLGFRFLDDLRRVPALALLTALVPVLWLAVFFWSCPFGDSRFLALTTLATAFMLMAALISRIQQAPVVIKTIGQRSFSMYITHFIFMNMIDHGFNNTIHLLVDHPNIKAVVHFFTAVTLTYITAGLSKRYIEDPFVSLGNRIILRTKHIETRVIYTPADSARQETVR